MPCSAGQAGRQGVWGHAAPLTFHSQFPVYGDDLKYGRICNPTLATNMQLLEEGDKSGIQAYAHHFCIQTRFFFDQGP